MIGKYLNGFYNNRNGIKIKRLKNKLAKGNKRVIKDSTIKLLRFISTTS